MSPLAGQIAYLVLACLGIAVAGHILRVSAGTLVLEACPEDSRAGAAAASRLIVVTFYLFAIGFVLVIASIGKEYESASAVVRLLAARLGAAFFLLGGANLGASLAIRIITERAATPAKATG